MLADALKWCRARKEILRDTHWVSGEGGVYGYASWHPTKGATVVIRNPGAQPQTFTLNPQEVFELPAGAAQNYAFTPALGTKADAFTASPAAPVTLTLQPFQVMLFDAAPAK